MLHFPLTGQEPAEAKTTVLFVDDDENILDIASDSLVDAGYSLVTAKTAQEALDIVSSGTSIDIVFSDVSMPGGLTGIDLANQLHESRPNLRVILTSGYSPNWLPSMPPNCEFLPKPYDFSDLDRLLKRSPRRTAPHRDGSPQ
ncbi:response regulator [Lysobacter sp. ISL-50]|uniref:response regulator n=1 Tax=unclassified Lysobacter TaxID=2635362 RepID=UPI0031BA3499